MNIQDEMQNIHHKYGVSEKANYEIEKFVEKLIEKDRAEQLILHNVSNRRELLISFFDHLDANCGREKFMDKKGFIDEFIRNL